MPVYDYLCSNCAEITEVIHGIDAPGPRFCPACGAEGTLRKAFAPPTFHFKGSGWAKKDRSTAMKARSKADAGTETGAAKADTSGGDSSASTDKSSTDKSSNRQIVDEVDIEPQRRFHLGRELGLQSVRLGAGLTVAPAATDWISLEEAAEILSAANVRFRPATIGGWARAGKVQSIKLGGRRFVRRGEIRALIAAPRRVRAADLQPGLFEELGD